MQRLLFAACIFVICSFSLKGNPSEVFDQGNKAFENKNYQEAIELYQSILSEGYEGAALYYNLGLASLKVGDIGNAVLFLERALKLKPKDKDIKHNLKVIRAQHLQNRFDIIPESFLEKRWNAFLFAASSNTWTILSIIICWLAALGFYFWLKGKTRQQRKSGFLAGLSLLFISILFSLLAYSKFKVEKVIQAGVTTNPVANFWVAPDEDSEVEEELYPGLKVDVLGELNYWYKVRLSDGRVGWLKKEEITLI